MTLVDPRIGPYGAGHMIMNKDKFEGLPDDLRKMLADMRYEWTILATRWVAVDAANTMKMIEENGWPLVRFTEEQFADWRKKMKVDEEFAALAEEYEGRGVPAKEALSRYMAITEHPQPDVALSQRRHGAGRPDVQLGIEAVPAISQATEAVRRARAPMKRVEARAARPDTGMDGSDGLPGQSVSTSPVREEA